MTSILHIHASTSSQNPEHAGGSAQVGAPIAPCLERAGYAWRALPADDSRAFMELVVDKTAAAPDLIIVEDTATCEKLKADPRTAHIPVLQLLAADAASTLGTPEPPALADAYVAQPVHAAALTSTVQLVLRAQRSEQPSEHEAQRQDDFLAMLAHELRNPLNAIVAANRLQDARQAADEDPAAVNENARLRAVVERQSRHLARLIDDLLDVSRITRGEISLRFEPVDLREVVERACESQRAVLQSREQALRLALPTQPVVVDGDELRLEQAISNLLANASKYSSDGAAIALRMREETEGNVRRVRVVLNDQGIGIPPNLLECVFDMFFQVDRSLDRTLGGLGLGLTVVKYVIDRHGGSVEAHSEGLGKGSRFVVSLPLQAEKTTLSQVPPAASVSAPAAPVDVLLIEDNDDTRELMCLLLENHGHRVVCAADGAEGIQLASESPPQVALIDIGLPGMNGYAVARSLRDTALASEPGSSEHSWPAPFLVALTGYGSPADRERSRAAGFDAHMVKPIDTSRLFELLRNVAQHRHSRAASAQSA